MYSLPFLFLPVLLLVYNEVVIHVGCLTKTKEELREEVIEMIHHAYDNYMEHAYPGDELMPLSCSGRFRGKTASRGDIDDSLGNFALTLVDSLDTLAVIGDVDRFEKAVQKVISEIRFDSDLVVSVFETNIRILGGLIGGHVMSKLMKHENVGMMWYKDELLYMAIDIADRLIPAFNTTTGVPRSRINLKYGFHHPKSKVPEDGTTCTACAGTFLLEFAALSRLMGDSSYETKAREAVDYIWSKRSLTSDLVGTIMNIRTGEWIKKNSGLGAGIDSYYEYIFKAYMLLGDTEFLSRFNKHYKAIKKYIHDGPLLLSVNMLKPDVVSRSHVDALSAFWPAIQVLKGDIKSAIGVHEIFYQVVKRHKFLPEAFNSDFNLVWNHHPIRPEFVESTYFLYKATGDAHYLDVAEHTIEAIQNYTRVKCGFAAISDVKTGKKEDRFDSFVIAETFKYLYLIFTDDDQLWFNVDDFIFTTEAHLVPINWKSPFLHNNSSSLNSRKVLQKTTANIPLTPDAASDFLIDQVSLDNTCHNYDFINNPFYAFNIRKEFHGFVKTESPNLINVEPLCMQPPGAEPQIKITSKKWTFDSSIPNVQIIRSPQDVKPTPEGFVPLSAHDFDSTNSAHFETLSLMGIEVTREANGNLQLKHTYHKAHNPTLAQLGMNFIGEAWKINEDSKVKPKEAVIQILSAPYHGSMVFKVGTALFGYDLSSKPEVASYVMIAKPIDACTIDPGHDVNAYIVIAIRGNCLFAEKARAIQERGGLGLIVIDSVEDTTVLSNELFSMSPDANSDDINIPSVFALYKEGIALISLLLDKGPLYVRLAGHAEYYEVLEQFYELDGKFETFVDVQDFHKYSQEVLGQYFELKKFQLTESLKSSIEVELVEKEDENEPGIVAMREIPVAGPEAPDVRNQNESPGDVEDEDVEEENEKLASGEIPMSANSVEVDLDTSPAAFAVAKMMITKHIIQMDVYESASGNDQIFADLKDPLAAVFYSEIPTLGMKVTWFSKSGSSAVSLLDNIKREHKTIIKDLRSQKFTKVQIDRMDNGVARLIGVNNVNPEIKSSDEKLNYKEDRFLVELMGEILESVNVDIFSSKVTVN